MTELRETKGVFKLIGKVTRIDRDGAYREGILEKGKNEGKPYRSLRFGVQTSPVNEVIINAFDSRPDEVLLWNSEKKKKDEKYKGDRVPFEKWLKEQEKYRENGYTVLQTRIGLTYDDKGKLQTHGMPRYVAIQEIYNNLNEGDPIVVEGDLRYSQYTNNSGQNVIQRDLTINRLARRRKLDFDDEKFQEVSYFEQEMVFVDIDIDTAEKKAYLIGRIIFYNKKFIDAQFVIDFAEDKDLEKLAKQIKKLFKFGDVVNVFGNIVNRVEIEEVEEDDGDDLAKKLGGKSKPEHAKRILRNYVSEYQILGVDKWEQGVYTEDDFITQEEENNDLSAELGGKKKVDNPFELDDDDDDNVDLSNLESYL